MRVVVVEPPPPGAPSLGRSPLAVGAFDWSDPDPIATVVVKLTYRRSGSDLVLAAEQRALSLADVASFEADLWGELHYPWDFAPHKPKADVLVVGHASVGEGPARERLPVRVSVGALDRTVLARAAAPSERIPLSALCLFTPDGEHPERLGPERVPAELRRRRVLQAEDDYDGFNVAPLEQRRGYFALGERIRLEGLSPQGVLEVELPREAPRVQVTWRGVLPDVELQMVADTLWIDADRELFVLVWRGMIATPRPASIGRLSVSLEREARSWGEILRSGARGTFSISAGPDEAGGPPRDDDERERIAAARADLALGALPPEPTVSLADYARISAELAEQRAPRAEVLGRHQLDETGWMLEERGWLEGIARQAAAGDEAPAAEYGARFVAAQDALAEPHEARRTRADWAELTAALEVAEDVSRELGRREVRLAEWMRLERRMEREAGEDEAVAEELEGLLGAARARVSVRDERRDEEPITQRPVLLGPGDEPGGDA